MSVHPIFLSDQYDDGLTKQSFKDSADINKILAKAQRGESIAHLAKHGATYADFSDIEDLMTAHERLKRGEEIFEELPAEVKREFNQSPLEFFKFVNDPSREGRLHEVLPKLAERGDQRVDVRRNFQNQVESPATPEIPPGPTSEEQPTAAPTAETPSA